MAEFIFKYIVTKSGCTNNYIIASAATSREEIGNDIYPSAKECLKKHGIAYEKHHARQITKDDLNKYDYVIAMEKYNIDNLIRLFGPSNKYHLLLDYTASPGDISDPWYSRDFEKAYNEIYEGCKGFLRYMNEKE